MVKFQKQLEDELVPEWKYAYCDYKSLKKQLKTFKNTDQKNNKRYVQVDAKDGQLMDAFISNTLNVSASGVTQRHKNIKVNVRNSDDGSQIFSTNFFENLNKSGSGSAETETSFFSKLDVQICKISKFYVQKESEFENRVQLLKEQIEHLNQMKKIFKNEINSKQNVLNINEQIEIPTVQSESKISNLQISVKESNSKLKSKSNSNENVQIENSNYQVHNEKNEEINFASQDNFEISYDYLDSFENLNIKSQTVQTNSEKNSISKKKELEISEMRISVSNSENNLKKLDKFENVSSILDNSEIVLDSKFELESELYSPTKPKQMILNIPPTTPPRKMNQIFEKINEKFLNVSKYSHNLKNYKNDQNHTHPVGLHSNYKNDHEISKNDHEISKNDHEISKNDHEISENDHEISKNDQDHTYPFGLLSNYNSDHRKINLAEKMIKSALIELYREVTFLKSYSILNYIAIVKILKKHDKLSGWNSSQNYLSIVNESNFHKTKTIDNILITIENIFIDFFSHNNRKDAMKFLKPIQKYSSHLITFSLGLFLGFSISILIIYFIFLISNSNESKFMNPFFPIYSTLFLLLLHGFLYGCDVYFWKKFKVNFPFIFEFAPKTETNFREIFFACAFLLCVLCSGMLFHILSNDYVLLPRMILTYIPAIVFMVFLILFLLPFNLFFYSSRKCLLICIKKSLLSPLYKVSLPDFFFADQMTSQVTFLYHLPFLFCYFFFDHSSCKQRHGFSSSSSSSSTSLTFFSFFFPLLPFWCRFMQCLRRYSDDRDGHHLLNALKYVSASLTLLLKLTHHIHGGSLLFSFFLLSSLFSTLYQCYWDIFVDWGLLRKHSKNKFLRDELVIKSKYIYFISMILNVLMRFAWVRSLSSLFSSPLSSTLNQNFSTFGFACLEVIRRGQWNFFRLENEHLNNVGKFRAVKELPLPFH